MDTEPLGDVIAVWNHSGHPADLVRELKYGRATGVVTELAEAMSHRVAEVDLITWVPASRARRRTRGFDQGELLARAIGRRRRLPVRRLLRRCDDEAQTGRDYQGRLAGPEFASVGRRLRFRPSLLLIDDVVTTGSTLRSAAEALSIGGAGQISALVATRAIRVPREARTWSEV